MNGPYLKLSDGQKQFGTIVVGTSKGDIHTLGKDVFCVLAEATGLVVHNMGQDVAPEVFIQELKDTNASILGMSALITTTSPYMA